MRSPNIYCKLCEQDYNLVITNRRRRQRQCGVCMEIRHEGCTKFPFKFDLCLKCHETEILKLDEMIESNSIPKLDVDCKKLSNCWACNCRMCFECRMSQLHPIKYDWVTWLSPVKSARDVTEEYFFYMLKSSQDENIEENSPIENDGSENEIFQQLASIQLEPLVELKPIIALNVNSSNLIVPSCEQLDNDRVVTSTLAGIEILFLSHSSRIATGSRDTSMMNAKFYLTIRRWSESTTRERPLRWPPPLYFHHSSQAVTDFDNAKLIRLLINYKENLDTQRFHVNKKGQRTLQLNLIRESHNYVALLINGFRHRIIPKTPGSVAPRHS